jgi:2-iminoacetate synthase
MTRAVRALASAGLCLSETAGSRLTGSEDYLEPMAELSQRLTLQRFGRTIKLYAPLYLSSHCVNRCRYCGFNRDNAFERVRLTVEQALAEAEILAREGFRDILLVSSEDRDFITVSYLADLAKALRSRFSFIGAEIYQMTAAEYGRLFDAGIEESRYTRRPTTGGIPRYHPGGPKADYDTPCEALTISCQRHREIGPAPARAGRLAVGDPGLGVRLYLFRRY